MPNCTLEPHAMNSSYVFTLKSFFDSPQRTIFMKCGPHPEKTCGEPFSMNQIYMTIVLFANFFFQTLNQDGCVPGYDPLQLQILLNCPSRRSKIKTAILFQMFQKSVLKMLQFLLLLNSCYICLYTCTTSSQTYRLDPDVVQHTVRT